MRKPATFFAVATLLGACASPGDPWLGTATGAAAVTAGQAAPILTVASPAAGCEARPAPMIAIVQPPALGAIFVEESQRPIDPEGATCPEDALQPVNTAFYETDAAGPAMDSVVLRETGDAVLAERDHVIQIRIR